MGGNILDWNFSGENFPGYSLIGGNFQGGILLEPIFCLLFSLVLKITNNATPLEVNIGMDQKTKIKNQSKFSAVVFNLPLCEYLF